MPRHIAAQARALHFAGRPGGGGGGYGAEPEPRSGGPAQATRFGAAPTGTLPTERSLPSRTSRTRTVPSPMLLTRARTPSAPAAGMRSTQHGFETPVVSRSSSRPLVTSTASTYERPSFAASTTLPPTASTPWYVTSSGAAFSAGGGSAISLVTFPATGS